MIFWMLLFKKNRMKTTPELLGRTLLRDEKQINATF
jgi:hypothetical protein